MEGTTRRFVLVPVPTAHVLDVMRWLVYRDSKRDDADEWDEARLRATLATLTDLPRAVIAAVADATLTSRPVRVRGLATDLHAEVADVSGSVQDINRRAHEQKLPELILIHRETETDENGNEQPVFNLAVPPDVASMLAGFGT